MDTEFDKLTTNLMQRGIHLPDYFEYLEVASPEFDKLTTTLTQRGVLLEKYQKYLNALKKAEFISLTAKLQEKGVNLEKYRDYLKQSTHLQKITKSTQPAIKSTQTTTLTAPSSSSSFETESLETQELKKIGLKLLGDFEMDLQELNQTLIELPPNKLNSRTLLQTLLRKRKIRVEDFLELDQGKWTQTREIPYKVRLAQGRPEFYADDQRGKIYGKYQVIQELARGGVGIVFKAIHLETNQLVALKVLIAGEDASETALNRFHREISSASKLKHIGIIEILDSGQEGGQHYFVMEFVEGKTLDKLLKEEIAIREGLQIIKKALEALHYAHTHKIIHRDIKPDNIFITKDGQPKIGDFGLARDQTLDPDAHQLTQTGAIMGTPKYMSPEQAMGDVKKVDARSDIYSMGVCLYQLLTLQYPYEANSLHQLLDQITHAEILPPSKHNANLPKDLDAITLKSLEKNPEKRYRTAKAFAVDIGRFLEGNTVRAKNISPTELFLKWIKRNRQIFAFLSFSLLLSLTFLTYSQWARRKEHYQKLEEQQKKFDTASATALHYKKKAETITIEGTEEKGQKIKYLLDALLTLNEALSIKPSHTQTEITKQQVGEQLVNLACELEEYQLASYVATELQSIKTLSTEERRFFVEKVESARTQQLKEHRQQFEVWVTKLKKASLEPQEQEEAVFEMSQLREEALFSQLLHTLESGIQYFLEKEQREPHLEEFYGIIVNVLGRQENKKACEPLLKALQKISASVSKKPLGQRSLSQLTLMIRIMQALGRLKDIQYLPAIQQIRNEMGETDLFCRRTYDIYQKMLILSAQGNTPLTQQTQDAKNYFESGENKRQQKNFAEAITDFNLALKQDPNYVAAYLHRGWARFDMGNLEEALQDFEITIRLDP
ncbi:MAG: protein kinase, partial [Planctomycetota bacterium]